MESQIIQERIKRNINRLIDNLPKKHETREFVQKAAILFLRGEKVRITTSSEMYLSDKVKEIIQITKRG